MGEIGLDLRARAASRLRELFRQVERFDALADLLEAEFGSEESGPEHRVAVLRELADLHEIERSDADATRDALRRLIDITGESAVRLRLADVCARAGELEEEIVVLRALVATTPDQEGAQPDSDGVEPDAGAADSADGDAPQGAQRDDEPSAEGATLGRNDFLLRLARRESDAEELDAAAATYRRLLVDPDKHDTALAELERVLMRKRDLPALMELLEAEAAAGDEVTRVRLVSKLANLAEHELGDLDRAIGLWRRALEIRPDHEDALTTLEVLYEATSRWDELVGICHAQVELSSDADHRAHLYRKIGRIHRQNEQLEGARDAYLALLGEIPGDALARQALYEIHRAREDWPELIDAITGLLALEEERGRRRELLLEQADLAQYKLDDLERATGFLEAQLEEAPSDMEAVGRLFLLHAARELWPLAARMKRKLADLAPDAGQKIEVLLELSILHREHLDDAEAATAVLEEVIAIHAGNRSALSRLDVLYTELERWEKLVRVRGRLLELTTEADDRVALLRSVAHVLEENLKEPAGAFERVVQAHEIEPAEPAHMDALYALAEKSDLWGRLLAVLGEDASRAPTVEARHAVQLQMAELVEEKLGDIAGAFDIYRDIFLDGPREGEILGQLERLAEADPKLWPEVVGLYERLVQLAADDEELIRLHWRIAELQRDGMQAHSDAFRSLERALVFDPESEETLRRMRGVAQEAGLWEALIRVGEARWNKVAEPAHRVEILLDTASLIDEHLDQPDRALEQYVVAFQIDPHHSVVEAKLRALAETRDDVKDLMLKLYEKAIAEADGDDVVEVRVAYLGRIASLHEAGEGYEAALDALLRAFALAPGREELLVELERVGERSGRLGEVAHAYQVAAEHSRSQTAVAFFLRSARLLHKSLGFAELAARILRRALEVDPDCAEAWADLEVIYREQNDLESLVALHTQRAERTVDRSKRYDAYIAVARLLERSDDPERAVEFYRRGLRLQPRDTGLLERLADLYDRLEELDHVARCLEQLAEIVEDEDELAFVATLDRLTSVYTRSRRPTRAAEVLGRLIALRPVRQDYFDRLDDVLRESGKLEAVFSQYEQRVSEIDGLIDEVAAVDSDDVPARLQDERGALPKASDLRGEQVRLLRAMTQLSEEAFRNPRRAVKVLSELLERYPDDVESLERLADLYAQLERWQDHIDALRRRINLAANPETAAMLLGRIAEVYEERLYHPDKAARVLDELTAANPDDGPALVDLGRLHHRLEEWDASVDAYRRAVTLESGDALPPDIQADVWCRIAEIEEKFRRDDDAAFEAYEQALRIHPDHPQARQAVIRYLARGTQWERHITLLRAEVERASSPERKAGLLWEIGVIFRDRGASPQLAMEAFDEALELDGDLLVALRDVADVAYQTRNWGRAVAVYTALLDGGFTRMAMESEPLPVQRRVRYEAEDEPSFVVYTVRLAVALEALGSTEAALERYVQARRARSTNLLALMGVGRLQYAAGNLDAARSSINKVLAAHGDAIDPSDKAELNYVLGCILAQKRQHARALESLLLALELDPARSQAASLALEQAVLLKDWEHTVVPLQHLGDTAEDPVERKGYFLRLGDIELDHLGNSEAAAVAYRRAWEADPTDAVAAERVLELDMQLERWEHARELSAALVAQLEEAFGQAVGADRATVRPYMLRLLQHGDILLRGAGDADAALAAYEKALTVDPASLDPLMKIGLVLGERGDFAALTARYDAFVDALDADDVGARVEVLRRLGTLLKDELGAAARAHEVYLELARLVPGDVRVHDALASLYAHEDLRDLEAALEAHRTVIALGDVTEERLRAVLELYLQTDRHGGARQLLRLLDFCRCTTREEQAQLRDYRGELAELKGGALNADAYWDRVRPPLARTPLSDLMAFVVQRAPGVVYQSLQDRGFDDAEVISHRRNLNVANIFRDVAVIVGLPTVDLCLDAAAEGVHVVLTRPPSVVIGEDVSRGLFNKEQRFVLGRSLELCRPDYVASAALSALDFMALYEALFFMGGGKLGAELLGDEQIVERVEKWAERLEDALEDDAEDELQALVQACTAHFEDRRPSAIDWRRTVRASAQRVGLFLSGDPLVALKRVLREEERLASPSVRSIEELSTAMETSADVREIVLFLLSDDFVHARRMLGGVDRVPADMGPSEPPRLPPEATGSDSVDAFLDASEFLEDEGREPLSTDADRVDLGDILDSEQLASGDEEAVAEDPEPIASEEAAPEGPAAEESGDAEGAASDEPEAEDSGDAEDAASEEPEPEESLVSDEVAPQEAAHEEPIAADPDTEAASRKPEPDEVVGAGVAAPVESELDEAEDPRQPDPPEAAAEDEQAAGADVAAPIESEPGARASQEADTGSAAPEGADASHAEAAESAAVPPPADAGLEPEVVAETNADDVAPLDAPSEDKQGDAPLENQDDVAQDAADELDAAFELGEAVLAKKAPDGEGALDSLDSAFSLGLEQLEED